MPFQFGDSFDPYAAVADAVAGYWDSGTFTGITLTSGRFVGSQALQLAVITTVAILTKSSGQNDTVHHLSVAFRQAGALSGATLCSGLQLLDGTTAQCTIMFRQDGAIVLTLGSSGGTVLATYTGAVTAQNAWFQFEFEVVIHPSAGSFTVRKNGNTANDFSATGLNTRPGTNTWANKLSVFNNQTNANFNLYDDLLWRSDAASVPWVGDIRCITRMPASDASVQFARAGVIAQSISGTTSNAGAFNTTMRLSPYTMTYPGTIASVSVTPGSTMTGNIKAAIYADSAGVPGAVLASAGPQATVGSALNTLTFSSPPSVTAGQKIWLALLDDTSTGNWQGISGGTTGGTAPATYATFPQANPTMTTGLPAIASTLIYGVVPNASLVNEPQQDGTTSYVYDATPGNQDLYNIASIASTPAATVAVTTRALMAKSDAGARTAAVQLKSGATTVASPTLALATGWLWAWRTDATNPATGAAWTSTQVNAVQVGPKTVA